MIPREELKIGAWYVGYRFGGKGDTQQAVEVRQWKRSDLGLGFYSPERGDFRAYRDSTTRGGFEPSRKEPNP